MILFFAGDCFGEIRRMYDAVLDLEASLGVQADWVLQVGNLGVWPDPKRADRATKRGGAGDFASLYLSDSPAPRPTVFISGKHDDHRWMNERYQLCQMELCPNLSWLVNGYQTTIGRDEEKLRVLGLGKVFSPSSYTNSKRGNPSKRFSHYTLNEVQRACAQGPVDLMITHEAPHGAKLGRYMSEAEGIAKVCFATRPKLLVHGHYDYSKEYDFWARDARISCRSLAREELAAYESLDGYFNRIA